MRGRVPTPKKDPPEQEPPCPVCRARGRESEGKEIVNVREVGDHGAKVGDVQCKTCEAVLEEDYLVKNPDFV